MSVSARDLRRRIHGARKVHQVTSAIERVTAVRLATGMSRLHGARPYLERLEQLAAQLMRLSGEPTREPPAERAAGGRHAIVVFGGDRALCGAFHHGLVYRLENALRRERAEDVVLIVVGRVIRSILRTRGLRISEFLPQPTAETAPTALRQFADRLLARFENGTWREVSVLFSRFVSRLKQEPTLLRILPVPMPPAPAPPAARGAQPPQLEPGPAALLARILPALVRARVYHAYLHSRMSELAARQIGMAGASENARTMADELAVAYNRLRQESITAEVREITLGSMAR